VPALPPHKGPVCAAHFALAQGARDSQLQVFSHCRTAEAILTLSMLGCPGHGVAEMGLWTHPHPTHSLMLKEGNKGRHQP